MQSLCEVIQWEDILGRLSFGPVESYPSRRDHRLGHNVGFYGYVHSVGIPGAHV